MFIVHKENKFTNNKSTSKSHLFVYFSVFDSGE
jgi:hypothetical protein